MRILRYVISILSDFSYLEADRQFLVNHNVQVKEKKGYPKSRVYGDNKYRIRMRSRGREAKGFPRVR